MPTAPDVVVQLADQRAAQLASQLAGLSGTARLYTLQLQHSAPDLAVEAFAAIECLHEIGVRDIIVLHSHSALDAATLLGQGATLQVTLADGSRTSFSGLIQEVASLGSDGALRRYRLRLVPWLWLLTQTRTSRVWQDKTVMQVVESLFADFPQHAAWAWSSEASVFLTQVRPRSFVAMYRETYFDFLRRLLAEEGISFRIEESAAAPHGHRVLLFADTVQAFDEDPTSVSAVGGEGIRYHAGRATEAQDAVIALGCQRTLQAARFTVASFDYVSKRTVVGSVPTNHVFGSKDAPRVENYDYSGAYAYASNDEANRYASQHMQASEARNKFWFARSTVRTLRPGSTFRLTQGPLNAKPGDASVNYAVLSVISVGVNNLPMPAMEAIAELFGPLDALLQSCVNTLKALPTSLTVHTPRAEPSSPFAAYLDFGVAAPRQCPDLATVVAKAIELGYANRFDAIRADIPWRPVLADGTGLIRNPRATAFGSQSAIVVGPNGETSPNGADEIYCDRLGRIRIKFHWQGQHDDANATCWVRVGQRAAGGGFGVQFLPRIGQEVLVKFLENDIDRPIVLGALYNGQGEGGSIPTPGGKRERQANITVFDGANDHRSSGQGNLAAGNSPVWHGASADSAGHRNASAQWGIRSKEFGGDGYNQLLFDDTDHQGRIQLKTTSFATELNLGHLLHTADNYRGSFRGTGAELRSDGYGAIRAARGIILSSYRSNQNALNRDPAGDNSAGQALLKQAKVLGQSFNDAAITHQTVGYGMHMGPLKSGVSMLHEQAAPLQALFIAASGMVDGSSLDNAIADAAANNNQTGPDKLPHSTDPLLTITAKAGLAAVAGQNLQIANGESVAIMSGQDTQFVGGNQLRMHSGQAIGILGGAVQPGEDQTGVQLIAAQQAIDVQAQSDELKLQARDMIDVVSANAHIDWAAAKWIRLSTAGGASILIKDGNITVECPGKITVKASAKMFGGPTRLSYPLPQLPKSICIECLRKSLAAGLAFTTTG